jgi:hypothetical protein
MIGVIADSKDEAVVREFFELFKTPWEFYRGEGRYEVLLCAGDAQFDTTAKLILYYSGRKTHLDEEQKIHDRGQRKRSCVLLYRGDRIPIYGDTVTFSDKESGLLTDESSQECAAYGQQLSEGMAVRIGYDLFSEIRHLLTVGQPPCNAHIPTMELHIALLRDLITDCGISVVEIPPVPDGYSFIACLTHDVDHPSLRVHKWDVTVFGFLFRAALFSIWDLIRGRISLRDLLANWAAALKIPFVYIGLAKDPWCDFADRYLEIEKDIRSTFFVIPFKGYSGKSVDRRAAMLRAARYQAREIASTIQRLTTAGCEVGLHGIDAWVDSVQGRAELLEIQRLTGAAETGVRMHWLYYDNQSAAVLEKSGAAYDATIGYNETVGYRAGTMQVYKPLDAMRLLELPLHVMDTALFYRSYLGLSTRQGKALIDRMIDKAVRLGGCFTVNWHDRSLVPERLWDACYRDVIDDLRQQGAWFSTAGQAVRWFQNRRAATFETDYKGTGTPRVNVPVGHEEHLPGLRLRIHRPRGSEQSVAGASGDYIDLAVNDSVDAVVPSEAS